jgi:hypothetical protein
MSGISLNMSNYNVKRVRSFLLEHKPEKRQRSGTANVKLKHAWFLQPNLKKVIGFPIWEMHGPAKLSPSQESGKLKNHSGDQCPHVLKPKSADN